ncbi:unnamed protein product [Cylindrotheca closterium]|uniref:Uncharacterized protein n=1 Tax=Cylindrotheca closterium TaxID=2856 RepID=A0AAD2GD43_9STRA|nr:unnamed protein product [Cylindrotheca closterium]
MRTSWISVLAEIRQATGLLSSMPIDNFMAHQAIRPSLPPSRASMQPIKSDSSFRQRLRGIGLEDTILQRHPSRTAATQHRNKRGRPIDGIFATSGVVIKAGGYYNFDEFFACDHRGLWIDIDLERSLGSYC